MTIKLNKPKKLNPVCFTRKVLVLAVYVCGGNRWSVNCPLQLVNKSKSRDTDLQMRKENIKENIK